jgi:archaemetzincin
VKSILLLPLGDVDRGLIQDLCPMLEETFATRVEVQPYPLDLVQFFDGERLQYNSTKILYHIATNHVAARTRKQDLGSTKILGIASLDLFIPVLTYVFGEAELGGGVSVISYHRLSPERYGLPRNRPLLLERTWKEAVHELGHSCGLIHCPVQLCVMHSSSYVEDIDLKGGHFCASCRRALNASAKGSDGL